jgi:hypothetical protein
VTFKTCNVNSLKHPPFLTQIQKHTPLSVRLLRAHEIFERLPKLLSMMPPALYIACSSSSSIAGHIYINQTRPNLVPSGTLLTHRSDTRGSDKSEHDSSHHLTGKKVQWVRAYHLPGLSLAHAASVSLQIHPDPLIHICDKLQ